MARVSRKALDATRAKLRTKRETVRYAGQVWTVLKRSASGNWLLVTRGMDKGRAEQWIPKDAAA